MEPVCQFHVMRRLEHARFKQGAVFWPRHDYGDTWPVEGPGAHPTEAGSHLLQGCCTTRRVRRSRYAADETVAAITPLRVSRNELCNATQDVSIYHQVV